MKKFLPVLVFFIPSVLAFSQCANSSNIYAFTYASKNYEVVKELKTWSQAASCAVQRGGYLVHIDSASEQTAIYNGILAAGVTSNYHPVNDGGGASYVWVGAADKATEGAWLWDGDDNGAGVNFWNGQGQAGSGGGSAVGSAYVNWGGASSGPYNEPDNFANIQDCAGIAVSPWPYGIASEWNDISCSNTLYYVIEYDASSSTGSIFQQIEKLTVYPNPVKHTVTVMLPEKFRKGVATVTDMFGRKVYEETLNGLSDRLVISLSGENFPEGIYELTITGTSGKGGIASGKLVK